MHTQSREMYHERAVRRNKLSLNLWIVKKREHTCNFKVNNLQALTPIRYVYYYLRLGLLK